MKIRRMICCIFVLAAMCAATALASLQPVYDSSGNLVDPNAEGFEPAPGETYYQITLNGEKVPVDLEGDASDYFPMMYVNPEDLGDESVPLAALLGGAVLTAAGIAVVHRARGKLR